MTTPLTTWLPDSNTVVQIDMSGSSNSSFTDSSGNSFSFDVHGSPTDTPGVQGNGRSVVAGDYFRIVTDFYPYISGTKKITIEAMINVTALPGSRAPTAIYFQRFDGTNNGCFFLLYPDGGLDFNVRDSTNFEWSTDHTQTTGLISVSQTYHIRGIVDFTSNSVKLFSSNPGSPLIQRGTTVTTLSSLNFASDCFTQGIFGINSSGLNLIDKVRVSNSVRTDYFPLPGAQYGGGSAFNGGFS